MPNKIWRKNFSVSQVGLHMTVPAIMDMMIYQGKITGKLLVKELVFMHEGYECTGAYIPIDQLRRMVQYTLRLIQKNPQLINRVHKETITYNTEYFTYAKNLEDVNFSKFSSAQLANYYNKLNYLQMRGHGSAIATTWFVDSDGEDFSKLLLAKVESLMKSKKLQISIPEVFSILTTPNKPSMLTIEELESLQVLEAIRKDGKAKEIFSQKSIKQIEKDLPQISHALRRKIIRHFKKWRWTAYTYIGPAYELDYYLSLWSGLLREKFDIERNLRKAKEYSKIVRLSKTRLLKKLQLSLFDRKLFQIAADIIYLKAYRKDVWFYGCYIMEKIHKEIAKRLNLSLKQVRFLAYWEVEPALKKDNFSEKILNDRITYTVYYQKGLKGKIYSGKRAKIFLSKLHIEKEKIIPMNELVGTCACPGSVKGTVKIVNQPDEMAKMNKGDIMVAHTTFPSLVPAMRKASAIVTDDGGITCHAAIVARELKTPCVVGTKIATKVLHDGDRVEVDADKGIVKKI